MQCLSHLEHLHQGLCSFLLLPGGPLRAQGGRCLVETSRLPAKSLHPGPPLAVREGGRGPGADSLHILPVAHSLWNKQTIRHQQGMVGHQHSYKQLETMHFVCSIDCPHGKFPRGNAGQAMPGQVQRLTSGRTPTSVHRGQCHLESSNATRQGRQHREYTTSTKQAPRH